MSFSLYLAEEEVLCVLYVLGYTAVLEKASVVERDKEGGEKQHYDQ